MHGLHPLITDLMLITIYAAITTLIFKKLKQPMVLGYLLAGIFAGPFFNFVPTVTDRENLNLWADIGVIFLLFSLGLEFSVKKMMSVGKSAMITATLNIFLLLFVGYYVGLFIGWSTTDSFFLGSMISMSSTTIIIKAFDDLNVKKQKFTDLVFGVLVIEDIMGILILVLLPTIAIGKGINGGELGFDILKLFAFLILCFVFGIYIVPTMLKKLKNFLNDEMLLLVTIALSLSMVYLAVYFGFSSALGAFVMGSILSETGVILRIENIIKPLKDFFGAVFFVTVGMMVDPQMIITYAYPIFIITLVVIFGQVTCSIFGFIISGQSLKTAIYSGFSLAQVGEFAFIIASLGMSIGVLDNFVYPIIVAVSVITTFLTPIIMRSAGKAYKFLDKTLPQSWLKYIDENTVKGTKEAQEERLWRALFKGYFVRMILFSLILSAIIAFMYQIVRPYTYLYLPTNVARVFLTFLALLLMSPFLKGLIGLNIPIYNKIRTLVCEWPRNKSLKNQESNADVENGAEDKVADQENQQYKQTKNSLLLASSVDKLITSNNMISRIYSILWSIRKTNRLPLMILTSFRLIVVSFFIITAVHMFLTENPKVIFVLLLASIWLITRSKLLLDQYVKMEKQFLNNLKGEKEDENP